ncbi:MAG TPA: hypothetical protein VE398_18475 [Acidobacteriota bacterium]|nr:hypothetical protein [Acidobacteriota bacterium]
MKRDFKDLLVEEAASAFRERDSWGRVQPSPAWWDLPPEERLVLFKRQLESRLIERALDPEGFSNSVRSVLSRLR